MLTTIGYGITAFAGCVSGHSPNRDDSNEPGNDDWPSLGDATIETVDAQCADPDFESVVVERDDGHILLTGTRLAPTPCYEAVLDAVETDGAALEVTIDRESVLAEDEECAQCVGGLTYEVVIEVTPPDAIDRVNVHHADGGTYSVQFDEVNEEAGGSSEDHLAKPGGEINTHLYNEYSDELEVQVEITPTDDGPITSESLAVAGGSSTGLGTVGEVFADYTVNVAIDALGVTEQVTVEADGRGTIEIRIGEDRSVVIVFIPID